MTKSTATSSKPRETDIFGFLVTLTVAVVVLLFSRQNKVVSETIMHIILAITALFATFLYFYRVMQLQQSARTPFADTVILLSGLYLTFFLLVPPFDISLTIPFYGVIVLLATGIVSKLLLLDRLFGFVINGIITSIDSVLRWIITSPFNLFRSLFWTASIVIAILSTQIQSDFPLLSVAYLLAGIPFLTTALIRHTNQANVILRFMTIGGGIFALISLFMATEAIEQLTLGFLSLSLLIWAISIGLVLRVVNTIVNAIQRIWPFLTRIVSEFWNYIRNHPITAIRTVSFLSGTVLLIIGLVSPSTILTITAVILLAIAILPSIFPVMRDWTLTIFRYIQNHPVGSFQVLSLVGAILAWLLLPRSNNVNVLVALFLVVLAILPTAINIIQLLGEDILLLLADIKNWVVLHQIGTIQLILLIGAIPAFIFLPSSPQLVGFQFRTIVALGLVLLGLSPTVYQIMMRFIPALSQFFQFLFEVTKSILFNTDAYFFGGLLGGIVAFTQIDPTLTYLRLAVLALSTFCLSMLGNSFLMRFYDSLTYGLFSIGSPILRFFRYIFPRLTLGVFVSITAWMLLLFAITLRLFFPDIPSPGLIRFILIILSIIIWNMAYTHRRERFWRVINRLTGGIVSRLVDFSWWVIRNVWLIILWGVALGFFVLSLGLILPGSLGFVSNLFGELDYLVSFIIGGFMFSMGIFTIRQAIIRRSDLQIRVEGGKSS